MGLVHQHLWGYHYACVGAHTEQMVIWHLRPPLGLCVACKCTAIQRIRQQRTGDSPRSRKTQASCQRLSARRGHGFGAFNPAILLVSHQQYYTVARGLPRVATGCSADFPPQGGFACKGYQPPGGARRGFVCALGAADDTQRVYHNDFQLHLLGLPQPRGWH